MYKIILYNKWSTKDKWLRVKATLYQTEAQYKKFLEQKKNWCTRICRPLKGGTPTHLSAKLICQKMVEDKWVTIKEFEYGI